MRKKPDLLHGYEPHHIFQKHCTEPQRKRNSPLQDLFFQWLEQISVGFHHIQFYCHTLTTHVMTRSVVTGNLTSISCHSGAQFFYNNLYPALTGQSFLSEHGHCKFIFHNVLQPILSPLLLYIYVHICSSQIVFLC